ncbi:unnamed protein product [Amoebophrya sp. A120]|nr:unnamed protein product [Amoebophrya sp. A120]|eukprot:GSA120T00011700001.1
MDHAQLEAEAAAGLREQLRLFNGQKTPEQAAAAGVTVRSSPSSKMGAHVHHHQAARKQPQQTAPRRSQQQNQGGQHFYHYSQQAGGAAGQSQNYEYPKHSNANYNQQRQQTTSSASSCKNSGTSTTTSQRNATTAASCSTQQNYAPPFPPGLPPALGPLMPSKYVAPPATANNTSVNNTSGTISSFNNTSGYDYSSTASQHPQPVQPTRPQHPVQPYAPPCGGTPAPPAACSSFYNASVTTNTTTTTTSSSYTPKAPAPGFSYPPGMNSCATSSGSSSCNQTPSTSSGTQHPANYAYPQHQIQNQYGQDHVAASGTTAQPYSVGNQSESSHQLPGVPASTAYTTTHGLHPQGGAATTSMASPSATHHGHEFYRQHHGVMDTVGSSSSSTQNYYGHSTGSAVVATTDGRGLGSASSFSHHAQEQRPSRAGGAYDPSFSSDHTGAGPALHHRAAGSSQHTYPPPHSGTASAASCTSSVAAPPQPGDNSSGTRLSTPCGHFYGSAGAISVEEPPLQQQSQQYASGSAPYCSAESREAGATHARVAAQYGSYYQQPGSTVTGGTAAHRQQFSSRPAMPSETTSNEHEMQQAQHTVTRDAHTNHAAEYQHHHPSESYYAQYQYQTANSCYTASSSTQNYNADTQHQARCPETEIAQQQQGFTNYGTSISSKPTGTADVCATASSGELPVVHDRNSRDNAVQGANSHSGVTTGADTRVQHAAALNAQSIPWHSESKQYTQHLHTGCSADAHADSQLQSHTSHLPEQKFQDDKRQHGHAWGPPPTMADRNMASIARNTGHDVQHSTQAQLQQKAHQAPSFTIATGAQEEHGSQDAHLSAQHFHRVSAHARHPGNFAHEDRSATLAGSGGQGDGVPAGSEEKSVRGSRPDTFQTAVEHPAAGPVPYVYRGEHFYPVQPPSTSTGGASTASKSRASGSRGGSGQGRVFSASSASARGGGAKTSAQKRHIPSADRGTYHHFNKTGQQRHRDSRQGSALGAYGGGGQENQSVHQQNSSYDTGETKSTGQHTACAQQQQQNQQSHTTQMSSQAEWAGESASSSKPPVPRPVSSNECSESLAQEYPPCKRGHTGMTVAEAQQQEHQQQARYYDYTTNRSVSSYNPQKVLAAPTTAALPSGATGYYSGPTASAAHGPRSSSFYNSEGTTANDTRQPTSGTTQQEQHGHQKSSSFGARSVTSATVTATGTVPAPESSASTGSCTTSSSADKGSGNEDTSAAFHTGRAPPPKVDDSVYQFILDLRDHGKREAALFELSRRRETLFDLAPLLWHSFGTVAVLCQEIISVYPFLGFSTAASAYSPGAANKNSCAGPPGAGASLGARIPDSSKMMKAATVQPSGTVGEDRARGSAGGPAAGDEQVLATASFASVIAGSKSTTKTPSCTSFVSATTGTTASAQMSTSLEQGHTLTSWMKLNKHDEEPQPAHSEKQLPSASGTRAVATHQRPPRPGNAAAAVEAPAATTTTEGGKIKEQRKAKTRRVPKPPTLTAQSSNRVCNALALLQCMASHMETRPLILRAELPLLLFPFLNTETKARPYEYLRLTSLGVLGALVKGDDPDVLAFLLQKTEIIPLCLRIMETGTALSQTVATFILQKLLLDERGLAFIGQKPERCFHVFTVLRQMVQALVRDPAIRLLKHVVRCYLRLSDHPQAREALRETLPDTLRAPPTSLLEMLRNDNTTLRWLHTLWQNLGLRDTS